MSIRDFWAYTFVFGRNYSGSPSSTHSHFEHFVFFPAFDKAKNAHRVWGSPIRLTVQKQCFLRASTTLHCFCTVSLNSYGLYNNITRLPIEKQEKNGILKEILRGRGMTCQITFLLHYPNIVRRISCRCICQGTKEIRCVRCRTPILLM